MSQNLLEICTILVDDIYGELTSQVFSILMRLGRASLAILRAESRLPLRNLRNALAVLIQQQLCLWHTDDDGTTHYEANWYNAYALIQSGKIIKLAEDHYGDAAGTLVSNLLELGHCKVGDLESAYEGLVEKKPSTVDLEQHHLHRSVITNGCGNYDQSVNGGQVKPASTHINSVCQLHAELKNLLKEGLIAPVGSFDFKPDADIHNEAATTVRKEQFRDDVKGTKAVVKYEYAITRQKRSWRDSSRQALSSQSPSRNLKRKRTETDSANKRQKVNGNLTNETNEHLDGCDGPDDEDFAFLEEDLVVRVDYEKCNVLFRSAQLTSLCNRFLGENTAKVYEAALRLMEKRISRCYDPLEESLLAASTEDEGDDCEEDHTGPRATSHEVAGALDPGVDLKKGLGHVPTGHDKGDTRSKRQTTTDGDLDDEDDIRIPRNNARTRVTPESERQQLVRQHMGILREDPRHFVRWETNRAGGEWGVDFRSLTKYLIQTEIENTIAARYGKEATRVIRVLYSKGKLDEKQVSKFGFLREKHVRTLLTRMQETGFVEVQEVPKDNHRQPSRTIFLWYFDQERCRRLILNDTYQAMARLLQRARFEKERVRNVLDKAERTDVKGKEDRFLSDHERMALRRWMEVEEVLLTQLSRQDDLVTLFRDFVPIEAV